MRDSLLKLYVKAQVLKNALKDENGQDLVEYAAVIVLVVLALAGGMSTLANGINTAMTAVGTKVSTLLKLVTRSEGSGTIQNSASFGFEGTYQNKYPFQRPRAARTPR